MNILSLKKFIFAAIFGLFLVNNYQTCTAGIETAQSLLSSLKEEVNILQPLITNYNNAGLLSSQQILQHNNTAWSYAFNKTYPMLFAALGVGIVAYGASQWLYETVMRHGSDAERSTALVHPISSWRQKIDQYKPWYWARIFGICAAAHWAWNFCCETMKYASLYNALHIPAKAATKTS